MDEALQAAIRQYQAGQFEDAAQRLKGLLRLQPYNSDALHYFGLAVNAMGQRADAITLLSTATVVSPTVPQFHTSLANVLFDAGETQCAIDEWQKAIALDAGEAQANHRLASIYRDTGDVSGALACLNRSLETDPDQPKVRSEMLYLLYHDPGAEEFSVYGEHLEYFRRHAVPLAIAIQPHTQEFRADRPIRIGYICPDFRNSQIACFIAPILKFHRNPDFQIALYSDAPVNSSTQPQASPHLSHGIATMDDHQVADLIRHDQIDILVDLGVHSPGNRMLVFAQKPAPIQVTYLPYPGSTGLSTVMYRLTDVLLDPHGSHADFRIENLVRLPGAHVCYLPPSDSPVTSLPPLPVRVGCSCRLAQLNAEVLRVWSRILEQIPDVRLCIEAPEFHNAWICKNFQDRCAGAGIPTDQLEQQPYVDAQTSFQRLSQLHLALDPFPFNTMATACDALWAGVPVIALSGKFAPGRFGLSLLTHIAQPELVAKNVDAYVDLAVALAKDQDRLIVLRATLRQLVIDSKLIDGERFVHNLEAAYREMWHRRCSEAKAPAAAG